MVNNSNPLVSVFMISYNQEKYIIEALESVLIQSVNFDYEVVLSDDCSTDNTQDVVELFLSNHPLKDKVRFIKQPKNLGWMPNFIFTLKACKGKYIAMCEGDDYWTNPKKLQKQIDLLEKDPETVFACHRYTELYNDGKTIDCPWFRKDFFKGEKQFYFVQKDFEQFLRIQTMTIVFRRSALNLALKDTYDFYCDTHIKYHILDHGRGVYTQDNDAIYRIHGNNVYMSQPNRNKLKFTYDVYKDLITKGRAKGFTDLLNLSMRQRIANEIASKKMNILDVYYQDLLKQQYHDVKSLPLFFKNQFKGLLNF